MLFLAFAIAFLSYVFGSEDDCQLFFAPTSLKRGGWGVFAGRSYEKGDVVETGSFELQLGDPEGILDGTEFSRSLWKNGTTFIPGLGSIVQHHSQLFNVEKKSDTSVTFVATRAITAGEELFVDRRNDWYDGSEYPSQNDYQRADSIVKELLKHHYMHPKMSEVQWSDLLYRIKSEIISSEELLVDLLPNNLADLVRAEGGVAYLDFSRRESSVEWLITNGFCLELERYLPGMTESGNQGMGPISVATPVVPFSRERIQHILVSGDQSLRCFGLSASILVFCPLSSLFFSQISEEKVAEFKWIGDTTRLGLDKTEILQSEGSTSFMLAMEFMVKDNFLDDEFANSIKSRVVDDSLVIFDISNAFFPARWREDYIYGRELWEGTMQASSSDGPVMVSQKEIDASIKCGLYLAPSTIPNAGLGLFSGTFYGFQSRLGTASLSLLFEMNEEVLGHGWVGDDYSWADQMFHAEFNTYGRDQILVTDVGALCNSLPGRVNTILLSFHEPFLDGRRHAGSGAISEYEAMFVPSRAIYEGEELFVNYGERWWQDRADFIDVPLEENFQEADAVIGSVLAFARMSHSELEGEILDAIVHLMPKLMQKVRTKSVLSNFHSIRALENVFNMNGTSRALLDSSRSIAWLEQHGHCMDNLYVARSLIESAGRGAFARRPILEGETIQPSPLVPLSRHHLKIALPGGVGKRLITNYVFSHNSSSLVFYPTSSILAINHHNDPTKINARIRFAEWDKKSQYYLRRPLADLRMAQYATIVLEVVAIRNINVDEEIYLDYGHDWALSWREHVKKWRSKCHNKNKDCYSSREVKLMNNDKFNNKYHIWSEYHFTACYVQGQQESELIIENTTGLSPHLFDNKDEVFILANIASQRRPCEIVDFDAYKRIFDVIVYDWSGDSPSRRLLKRYFSLEESRVYFESKPFKSDVYDLASFRHEIAFPDEIFPQIWKDL